MLRLAAAAATSLMIAALFFAFVAWPALMVDGIAQQDRARSQCLKFALTAEEIRQCDL